MFNLKRLTASTLFICTLLLTGCNQVSDGGCGSIASQAIPLVCGPA
ncbi:Uncharacterised protein [Leminorella richardii]|uniref:Lipoprotein n=1 Tax=Leminorella richardii TaxID=158841 RepID=A0A2X4XPN7_9GAMM|nr:hypothetical protein [Leminorella richardii]SQI38644.1 Uncharacterised protein [Leminorella richardii]